MLGETEPSGQGWTVDTLREYIQHRFEDQQRLLDERYATQTKNLDTAFAAADRAVTKTEMSLDKRFEGVNEFRQTLSDQAATFMPRTEANVRFDAIMEKLDDVIKRQNKDEGLRDGALTVRTFMFALITAVGILAGVYLGFR